MNKKVLKLKKSLTSIILVKSQETIFTLTTVTDHSRVVEDIGVAGA